MEAFFIQTLITCVRLCELQRPATYHSLRHTATGLSYKHHRLIIISCLSDWYFLFSFYNDKLCFISSNSPTWCQLKMWLSWKQGNNLLTFSIKKHHMVLCGQLSDTVKIRLNKRKMKKLNRGFHSNECEKPTHWAFSEFINLPLLSRKYY